MATISESCNRLKKPPNLLLSSPSRWGAQSDTVKNIFEAKTEANPESSVGLMTMGGKGPEVLTTLTTDLSKILNGLHRTKIHGHAHLATGIQIAGVMTLCPIVLLRRANDSHQLALKHRQNNSQRQRIIVFTCSPIREDERQLVTLAKKMKKNTVSIDFVAFGDLAADDTKKLEAFNESVKGGESSHLAIVPPGPGLLSDQILGTPIIGSDAGARGAGMGADDGMAGTGGGGGEGFEFDVDPSADPELALALRMSMEEEKARLDKETKSREDTAKKESLAGIPEEGGEGQPLWDKEGEPSGSGEGKGSGAKEGGEKKDDAGDADKMDTA